MINIDMEFNDASIQRATTTLNPGATKTTTDAPSPIPTDWTLARFTFRQGRVSPFLLRMRGFTHPASSPVMTN